MADVDSYQTAKGRRYRARYRTPDNKQTSKRGFRTKREAELFLASIDVSNAPGEFIPASAPKVTVGSIGAEWLATQTHLKPSSFKPVESAWRIYVEPRWGATPIGRVQHSDVAKWVSEVAAGTAKCGLSETGPRSATTVLRVYGVLAAILDVAVKDRKLLSNPARDIRLPKKAPKTRVYLSHAQVDLLARSAFEGRRTLLRFLAYTGLRWGEATALRIGDIDLERRRVFVQENAVDVNGTVVVGSTKGDESRSVPYSAFLHDELASICASRDREKLVVGNGVEHLKTPDVRRGWYVGALNRARERDATMPRLTIHDLRHTAASLAISSGANVKAVQRMLGHKSAAMTLDTYADLFDDDLDAVAVALDAARAREVSKMWPDGLS